MTDCAIVMLRLRTRIGIQLPAKLLFIERQQPWRGACLHPYHVHSHSSSTTGRAFARASFVWALRASPGSQSCAHTHDTGAQSRHGCAVRSAAGCCAQCANHRPSQVAHDIGEANAQPIAPHSRSARCRTGEAAQRGQGSAMIARSPLGMPTPPHRPRSVCCWQQAPRQAHQCPHR